MKQKTAMMEAFEHLNRWLESGMAGESWLVNYKDKWLQEEKQQIIDAHGTKTLRGLKQGIDFYKSTGGEEYYNETYKQY